ncbi:MULTISPECIES: class I SAM-dependent methyltransferase [unclassified Coleofasciculus]|uniref:class I SAM-dependent methyltransferase n=1 Tax=unclassified Coleofasciculus TaxID=2692782 RepID=UPI001880A87D|nr:MULTISPECIES: class I SAM-dependent methyltransferase [unclassified Coleofasciculus]MBE9127558.1 class I SAM-dependent methyltransferase [Coleofasciculus sp. LEGE 07081]MBE9147198.1 class I SAM-dependent methyltransferase [Coleofasciculus sp. LEGE 07092]
MLPKSVNNFIDGLLLTTFKKIPSRFVRRLLWLLHTHPTITDKWGYYIRQVHYYEPLPDFSKITHEQTFKRRYSDCIDWNFKNQIELVHKLSSYYDEIHEIAKKKSLNANFDFFNPIYVELDAAVYYALIREIKPSKVIEIGAGYSTQLARIAIARNHDEGKGGNIICIEPYPQPILSRSNLEVEVITERVETIELGFFEQLSAGDILFIDSTHTVKFGGDVCREILEILPTLASGVWVHFHDIFFPYDYPPKWLIDERRAWNEQYMLEAFLAYNSQFEVVLANHWLAIDYPQEVAKIWSGVLKWEEPYHKCGSLWLRKK